MIRRLALVMLVLLAVLPATGLGVTVNEVAREVRCPTCDTPLDVSSAPVAIDMKRYIAQRIEAGWEKDRIIDGLVDEFGEGVLATPPKSGFDLVAWLVPAIVVLVGLAAIPVIARAWARPAAQEAEPPEPSPEEARRLEEELRRLP